jgi:hypothetical protein
MSAVVRLPISVADVEPGASTSLELTVRNTGTVVDQFSFEVLGGAATWATFDPPTVSLFPQAEETIRATFSPPRATDTASGAIPFGIRVQSREDPEGSVVEEGTLNVAEFSEVTAELTPHATRVWLRGQSQVAVDNRSNVSYRAELSGADGDSAFGYTFRPPLVDVAPGSVAFAKVTVRPKSTYWRGPSTTEPYQVALRQQQVDGTEPGGEPPLGTHPPEVLVDGAILRDALLPVWIARALAGLLALVAILALLWFTLVKPQINAAAQNQVKKQITPVSMALNSVASTVASLATSPTTAPGSSSGGQSSTTSPGSATSSPGGTGTSPSGGSSGAGSPVNASLTAGGNNTTASFAVPKGKTLEVTDILLENSAGASGNVYLQDSGKVLMSWALANFRDLDYHWITPVYFRPNSKLELVVKDCPGACTPSLYFAGSMKSA